MEGGLGGGECGVFNYSNPFFIRVLLYLLMLSVAGRELSVSVQRGMGVEHPNIEEGSLKDPTSESMHLPLCLAEHRLGGWLKHTSGFCLT